MHVIRALPLMIVASLCLMSVSQEKKGKPTESKTTKEDHKNGSQPSGTEGSTGAQPNPPTPKDHGPYQVQVMEDYKNWHYVLPLSANIVIAAVGVFASFVAWNQSQTARKSADAFINSQRAWVVMTPETFDFKKELFGPYRNNKLIKFAVSVKNVGVTPAHVLSVSLRYRLLENLNELPAIPDYTLPTTHNMKLMAPSDSFGQIAELEGFEGDPLTLFDEFIKTEKKFVYAYGYVKYTDISGLKRETRVGYQYQYLWLNTSQPQVRIVQSGPAAYNQLT